MTQGELTTLQLTGSEIVAVLADDVRVLNDRASAGSAGGGDVDCAVRGMRPFWHLRLRDWRLCQALRYDITATYYVLARGNETLALDVLDDPAGVGKYRFSTALLARGEPGSLAAPSDRGSYLTVKRIVKNLAHEPLWDEIGTLARQDPAAYRARLEQALGPELADEMTHAVESSATPSPDALARSRRVLARSRRTPEVLFRRARRVVRRASRPNGLVVELVGPDGSGKSTLAAELPDSCGQLFRRSLHIHFRPGVLPRPGAVVGREYALDTSNPHDRQTHGRVLSAALLAYYWLDTVLGHLLKVAPARLRTGLVIVERGFADIAVDPARYRLSVRPGIVRALSRVLPAPDLTLVLDAPPEVIASRKPELPTAEIARQSNAWLSMARGSRSERVDVTADLASVVADVRSHVVDVLEERAAANVSGGWASLPTGRHRRLYVPRASAAAAVGALDLVAPSKTISRVGLKLARPMIAQGGVRVLRATAPPAFVRRVLAPHVPPGGTYAVQRAVHDGRYQAVVLDASGSPIAMAKVATDDVGRDRLGAEKAAIERRVPLLPAPLRGPRILAEDDHALVLEWISYDLRPRPWLLPSEVARALGGFFASGMTTEKDGARGPAHGDFAPWNLLRAKSGWALVDWEVSLDDAPAFFDVFHYVVQGHSFLGRPRRRELLEGVEGGGWVGEAIAAYAEAAGLSPDLAASSFERYLEHTSGVETMRDMSLEAVRLRHALIAAVRP